MYGISADPFNHKEWVYGDYSHCIERVKDVEYDRNTGFLGNLRALESFCEELHIEHGNIKRPVAKFQDMVRGNMAYNFSLKDWK